jgi:hypothetical protein
MSTATTTGGNFKCYHGFDTDSVETWNEHCSDPSNNHTDSGVTQCVNCGCLTEFRDIPFQRITPTGKNINLRCPDCENSHKLTYDNKAIRKIENPEEGFRMIEPHEKEVPKKKRGKELE